MSLAPTHVSPSVRHTFETAEKGTHYDLSRCSELPDSKDGNASGVHEGLNARAMYMKAYMLKNVYEGLNAQKCI